MPTSHPILGFSDSQSGKWIASQLLCHQVDEEVPTRANHWPQFSSGGCVQQLAMQSLVKISKGEKGDDHLHSLIYIDIINWRTPHIVASPRGNIPAACSKAGRIGAWAPRHQPASIRSIRRVDYTVCICVWYVWHIWLCMFSIVFMYLLHSLTICWKVA